MARGARRNRTLILPSILSQRTHLCVLLALTGVALMYLSFYPFNFQRISGTGSLHWYSPSIDSDWIDMLANFVLYLPLGFLTMAVWERQDATAVMCITLCGFVISTGVELAQMYLPGRDSNLRDLTFNTLGTAAGSILAWRAREFLSRLRFPWPPLSGLVLALLWTAWQMYPFFPILRRPTLYRFVAQLPRWEFQGTEFGDIVLAAILLYAFLGSAKAAARTSSVFVSGPEQGRGFTALLASALLIFTLFAQSLVFGMSYSNARLVAAIIGLLAAVLLWRPNRGYWMSLCLTAFCWVVFREMQPFSWISHDFLGFHGE